jgi:large-conductance mechanosensitive channel
MENSHLVHESVEQTLMSAVGNVKRFAGESFQQTEAYARESPGKVIAYSVGIGWLLSFLPIGSLIALTVRLMLRLIRPVLFMLSVAKVCELAADCCKGSPTNKA